MNQTVLKRILALLSESQAAVCDDCIAAALGLGRRQHANAECNRAAGGRIVRAIEICSRCGRRKLTNLLRDGGLDSGSASPSKPATKVNPPRREVRISLEGPTMTIMDYTSSTICAFDPDRA